MFELILLIFGLVWGSFIGAFKDRLDDPKSLLVGRSICPRCKKRLGFVDLIPVVGYLVLRGRCRYCRKPISPYYPLLEILCAALAIIIWRYFTLSASSVFLFVSLSFLTLAALTDIEDQEVDAILFFIGIASAALYLVFSKNFTMFSLWGALTYALIPFLLYLLSREKWMGLGDTFFGLWAGLLVGFPLSLPAVFLSFLLGALFGIIKLATGAKSNRIAFGPFLALGAIITLIWSQWVLEFYLGIFY